MALDRLSNITRSGLGSVYTYDVGGIISTGVITATSFAGNITGNIIGDVTGNLTGDVTGTATTATSLSGSPSIIVTDITASGNVSIAGTLTYEDVTNIDAVGLSTFQNGIHVTGGSVGIGTDNPQLAPLHIGPNTYSLNLQNNSSNKSIILFTKNSVPNDARTSIEANGELNGHLAVTVGDSERLRITGIGSVGINQSDPQRKLHVKSGVNNNDGALRIESSTNNIMDMGTDGTGHFINCVNTDPFRIKFAGTERLRIDSDGRVTMPYQPAFMAYSTVGQTTYGNGAEFILDVTQTNVGNSYSTSTGRFTAPVSGFYAFSYGIYSYNTGQAAFKKNGSDYNAGGNHLGLFTIPVANGIYGASIKLTLAANDTVSFGWRSGFSGDVYRAHGWFSGHLVG